MKKIEAWLIKRLLRISWEALGSHFWIKFSFGVSKGKEMKDMERKVKKSSSKEKKDQENLVGILAVNTLHVWFRSWFWHSWLYMLVYGSLALGGMGFTGYDNDFQPSLSFSRCHGILGCLSHFWASVCWINFRIQGEGGLKVHSQRPTNPLTVFGGIHGKAWGRSIGLGRSDLVLDCGKDWETGLGLWPSDLRLDCGKAWETRRRKIPQR